MDLQGGNQDELRRLQQLRLSQGKPLQVTVAPERELISVDGGSVIRMSPNLRTKQYVGTNPKTKVNLGLLLNSPDPKTQKRSIFEKIGDKFEANSPQDIYARIQRGDTAEYGGPKFWQQARDVAIAGAREIPRTGETLYRTVKGSNYASAADSIDKALAEKDVNKRQKIINSTTDPYGAAIQIGRTKNLSVDANNIEELIRLRDELRGKYQTEAPKYEKGLKRFLYGSTPVQSYQQRYTGLKKELETNTSAAQQILKDKGQGKISAKAQQFAVPVAATLVALGALTDTILDPTDVITKPGKKLFSRGINSATEQATKSYATSVIKTIASETDPQNIKKALIDSGVSDKTPHLNDMSQILARTNSPKDVKSIISGYKDNLEKLDVPSEVSHVTKADSLDSILRDGKLKENKVPIKGYEGQKGVFLQKGLDNPYTWPGEANIKIIYDESSLGKLINNGDEFTSKQAITNDKIRYIEVPNEETAVKVRAAGIEAKINPKLDERRLTAPQALEQAVDDLPAQSNISQAPVVQTAPEGVPSISADIAQGQIVQPKGASIKTNLGQKFIDDDYYIIQELKNIEKQTGEKGIVDRFMYESGLARHSNSMGVNRFTQSPEIQTALSGLDNQGLTDFNVYAAARRELANAREGLPTSKSLDELQAIVQNGAEFETRYNSLRDYYFTLAKDMRNAGLIDEAKYQQFVSDPDYIRLQRDFEDVFQTGQQGKSYNLGSTIASQKRTGSSREVLPVGETALEYTQRIQTEIQRNQVGKGLIEVLVDNGQAREISQKEAARRNVLKVLDNGSPRYFEVSKDMKEAVQRISPFQLDIVGKIFAAPGRLFRAGTTGLNPVFITKNLVRDQATQAIMSKDAAATSKYFLDGLGNAMKDFGIDNNDPIWNKFLSVAGDTTSYDLTRNLTKSKQVVKELSGASSKYGDAVLHPIRTIEDFASITEKATRFQGFKGIYEKAIKEGATEEEAMMRATLTAWQNTVDFNRAGQWGRVANLVFPYFNPGIQGSRQLARRVGEAPAQTLLKGTAFVGTPLLVATLWNMSDEQRKAVYNNIPEYEKQNSLIIVPPGTKQNEDGTYDVIKIPLPPGISNLYQPFRRGTEAAMGNPVEAEKILGDVAEAFSGPIKISEPSQNISTFTPQIIKPTLQAAANRDLYTGEKIVPDYIENSDAENQDKAYKGTSGTARFFGNILNKSPIKVERFIKDTFGTVGSQVLNASDRALAATGRIPEEQIGGQSVAEGYAKAFSKASGIENYNKSEGAKFYDAVENATKGLNKNEKEAFFGTVMPSRKDFKGSVLNDKTFYDSASKATTWLRYPKTFEASKAVDAEARKQGKGGDPIYDLPPDQLKTVLNMMANYSPGNYEEKAIKELNPWLEDFNKKRSAYFESVIGVKDASKDPMGQVIPKASKELEAKINNSKGLEGKDAAKFYEDNPDVTDFYSQLETYQRAKRAFLGLPQFDRYPTPSPEVKNLMDSYNALPKNNGPLKKDGTASSPARSAWIKSHPNEWAALTDHWNKTTLFNLQKDAATAVYEGIEMDQKNIDKITGGSGQGGYGGYSKFGFGDKPTQINLAKLLSGDKSYDAPSVNTKRKVQKVRYKVPKSIRKKTKVKLG
jgi:hypothetical protein